MHEPTTATPTSTKILKVSKFILFIALLLIVSALLVMLLWNWLMPSLFELRQISVVEAVGLLVLTRILFGGFRGFGGRRFYGGWGRMHMKQRWKEEWEGMTDDEREEWCQRRGHLGAGR